MKKRYYWLKLDIDFFDDIRIKKLRQLAGGDTFTCIYMKLMLLSVKNEGTLFLEYGDNFAEELALKIDEKIEDVKLTILYCENCNLIEVVEENEISIPQVITAIGSESDSAERVRRYREKKKLNNKVRRLASETNENAEKLQSMYNTICTSLPKCTKLTKDRKDKLNKRFKEYSIDEIEKALSLANQSDFLTGKTTSWKANIDFIFRNESNIQKIIDGNYSNNKKKLQANFEQRTYKEDEYEQFYK